MCWYINWGIQEQKVKMCKYVNTGILPIPRCLSGANQLFEFSRKLSRLFLWKDSIYDVQLPT